MSIRFSDLQVILPRTVQAGEQAQGDLTHRGANQHFGSVSVQETAERQQQMVLASADTEKGHKLKDDGKGHGGRENRQGRRKREGSPAGMNPDGLGENLDIRV